MSGLSWELDMVRDGTAWLLVAWVPSSAEVYCEEVAVYTPAAVRHALRTIMLHTVPSWPSQIVTDHARVWSGLGAAIGIAHHYAHHYRRPGEPSSLDRIARGLIDKLGADA